jgi:hypothetical protein
MAKQNIENEIRDKLAKKLNLIENGLTYIDDEYHLRNPYGAGGFVDIFANDNNNNFVIIELKRSDAASREAITELSKYVALLKRKKNLKNSEIRLIVISTHWHELFVPFSEFYHNTNYQLSGFKLTIDKDNNPISVEKVEPLPQIAGRNICRRHFIRYYKTDEDLLESKEEIVKQAVNLGIHDFILAVFNLNFIDPFYGATKVLYWAPQLKSRGFYIEQLTHVLDQENLDEILDFTEELDEDDTLDELSERLDSEINVTCETCEIGNPEKLTDRLRESWSLDKIFKYGIFQEDERLTDTMILMDLKGLTGTSFIHFFSTVNTENRSKFDEIVSGIETPFFYNYVWKHDVKDIISYCRKKIPSTILLSIFNKDDIFETIWQSIICNDTKPWVPNFLVVIDPNDSSKAVEIFSGEVVWKRKKFSINRIILEFFENFEGYILARHFGEQRQYNHLIMEKLGLKYVTNYKKVDNEVETDLNDIIIRSSTISEKNKITTVAFDTFLLENRNELLILVRHFENMHRGNGIFTNF